MPKSEGYEYGESDGFLKYFELCHRHDGEADSVRRNLQQVLKERDAQLTSAAMSHGLCTSSFKWAYQANVMNTLLSVIYPMVMRVGRIVSRC